MCLEVEGNNEKTQIEYESVNDNEITNMNKSQTFGMS